MNGNEELERAKDTEKASSERRQCLAILHGGGGKHNLNLEVERLVFMRIHGGA